MDKLRMNKNQMSWSAIESDSNVMTFETTISDLRWLSANKTGMTEDDAKGKSERDNSTHEGRVQKRQTHTSSLLFLRGKWGRCGCTESKSERFSVLGFNIMKLTTSSVVFVKVSNKSYFIW